jgi:hypothetical protein
MPACIDTLPSHCRDGFLAGLYALQAQMNHRCVVFARKEHLAGLARLCRQQA